jgi:hypothetical protein
MEAPLRTMQGVVELTCGRKCFVMGDILQNQCRHSFSIGFATYNSDLEFITR